MLDRLLANRYLILETLSSGGFGKTYKALDKLMPHPLICVIKQLTPPSADEQTMEVCRRLFEKEAKTLQILGEHSQIPRLLAYFEQDEEFYLSQEYIEGKPLDQELSEKQYSEIETVELLKDVLNTLIFVHQKKVIHRDVKPANLIRRYSDQKVVLIDFGAVKQTTTQIINTQGEAIPSIMIGTLGYMPSEQSQGYPTYASDIYALGIVAIQALTGKLPKDLERDAYGELIWLSEPDLKVSSQLVDIITKMVRFSLKERYNSAQAVLNDLKQLQSSRSTIASSSTASKKNIKLLTGLSIATLVAVGGWGTYQFTNDSQTTPTEFGVYQNDTLGIKMKYPTLPLLWTVNENFLNNEISFQNPQNSDKVDISIEPLSNQNYSLDEYTIDQTKIIRNNKSPDDISVTQTQLGDYDARQINYSIENNGTVLNIQHGIIFVDGKAYNLISNTQNNKKSSSDKVVKEMIDSFEVISDSP